MPVLKLICTGWHCLSTCTKFSTGSQQTWHDSCFLMVFSEFYVKLDRKTKQIISLQKIKFRSFQKYKLNHFPIFPRELFILQIKHFSLTLSCSSKVLRNEVSGKEIFLFTVFNFCKVSSGTSYFILEHSENQTLLIFGESAARAQYVFMHLVTAVSYRI